MNVDARHFGSYTEAVRIRRPVAIVVASGHAHDANAVEASHVCSGRRLGFGILTNI